MTGPSIDVLLKTAAEHHSAGRVDMAEGLYRQVVAMVGENATALHGLGLIARQLGELGEAAELIQRAIAADGTAAHYRLNLGVILAELHRLDEAIDAYREALRLKPDYAGALCNLGDALRRKRHFGEAIAACRKAIALQRELPEAHRNLGLAYRAAGQPGRAAEAFGAAITLRPDNAVFHSDLGAALTEDGELNPAILSLNKALELNPDFAEAHANLAAAFIEAGAHDAAVQAARRAIACDEKLVEGHTNLGIALCHLGKPQEAAPVLRHAAMLQPDHLQTLTSLGNAYHDQGDFARAVEKYRAALAINADHASANWNLALCLLRQGEFDEGWRRYQWRWKLREFRGRLNPDQPVWDGSNLNGQRILIHAEQGFGDCIQFIRYLPAVAARGGRIILGCPDELYRLFRQMDWPIEQWVLSTTRIPPFDLHAPLMSLAGILGDIPAAGPYLKALAIDHRNWRHRLAGYPGRKIGVAWAGRATHGNDRQRSMRAEQMAAVGEVAGVTLFSLQKDAAAPPPIVDLTGDLADFAETAALIENLDAVVCVDTAVAHLAGALGKPVYLLLPKVADWRWMLDRNDSPWYPSVKLYRQSRSGDWTEPLERVAADLKVGL